MTDDEIVSEVRSIAAAMAIRDVEPGFISGSVQYRARTLLAQTGVPMQPWKNHRQYLTKSGTAILNGKTVEMQVHKATVDDTAGELCRAIVGALLLADWRIHPDWQHWTAEQAERAIVQAAERLPKLCDQLEALPKELKPKDVEPRATAAETKVLFSSHEVMDCRSPLPERTSSSRSKKTAVPHARKGVSLQDAAIAVNDDSPELWQETKTKWQQDHRRHLLPAAIGKAASHCQRDLYDLNELCDAIAKLETHELAELCRERLRYKMQDVAKTDCKPSGPSAILGDKKKRKASKI